VNYCCDVQVTYFSVMLLYLWLSSFMDKVSRDKWMFSCGLVRSRVSNSAYSSVVWAVNDATSATKLALGLQSA